MDDERGIQGSHHCKAGVEMNFSDSITKKVMDQLRVDEQKGALLPWSNTHPVWQIRPGELGIITGKRGEGKSLITGMWALSFLTQQHKCLIASMEMPLVDTLERMERQALGLSMPSREFHGAFYDWLKGRLWLFDQADEVPARSVIGLCRYAKEELNCSHVFLDSLMMIKMDARSSWEKNEAQGVFTRRLATLAKSLGIHIHLIAHMRKSAAGTRDDSDSVKGAGEITDLASVVWSVSKNWRKVHAEGHDDEPDFFLENLKNRRGITGTKTALWLHERSLQLQRTKSMKAMSLVPELTNKSFGSSATSQTLTESF